MRKYSIRGFLSDKAGNFAVTLAVAAAPLLGAAGLAVDYVTIHNKRSELQQLADAAALAATRELSFSDLTDEEIQSIADSYVSANFAIARDESLEIAAKPTDDGNSVEVSLSYTWKPIFAHFLDQSVLPLEASASATFSGEQSSVCVLALDASAPGAIDMTNKASVTANGCSVFSNSFSTQGIKAHRNALIQGDSIYSSGGFDGADASFEPLPITDSPVVNDPLSARPAPHFVGCDKVDYSTNSNATLTPGTYCGGISTGGNAVVTLEPGIYVIKDGPLSISGNSSILGEGVGFYLTGDTAIFDFGVSTQVVLSAPTSGPLAGILFYEDRNAPELRTFSIRSMDAEKFEGTVYLPKGRLWIDKASRVGQLSDWTAIIARQFAVGNGPNIVINSDYEGSDIPVPEGIASKKDIRLIN